MICCYCCCPYKQFVLALNTLLGVDSESKDVFGNNSIKNLLLYGRYIVSLSTKCIVLLPDSKAKFSINNPPRFENYSKPR